MKDEIKEILDDLRNKDCYVNNETTLTFDEANLLLDYITNLQNRIKELEEINKQHQELNGKLRKENEELREYKENATRKHWQQKCAEHSINEKLLQIRIDKAIEITENLLKTEKSGYYQIIFKQQLNILQDKEEV